MLAQVGLESAVGGVIGPLVLLWLIALSYLASLGLFGLLVAGVRAWNWDRDIPPTPSSDQGESRTPKPTRGTTF